MSTIYCCCVLVSFVYPLDRAQPVHNFILGALSLDHVFTSWDKKGLSQGSKDQADSGVDVTEFFSVLSGVDRRLIIAHSPTNTCLLSTYN